MLSVDRDAVICDLAETYNILDYRSLPVTLLATLCAGLHDDSRIKMRMMGLRKIAPSFAFVQIADTLTVLLHALTGSKNKLKLYQDIMADKQQKKKATGFSSIEEFEKARQRLLNNG
jgi:hypothetical protein